MADLPEVLSELGLELVEARIGGGGSADVHKCRVVLQTGNLPPVGENVAIKEYKQSILEIPGQRARIQQEAELGQRLNHSTVVRTFGLHQKDDSNEGPLFLLLEWIDGETLDRWYANTSRPRTWESLRAVCLDVVRGVGELHKEGVFHRDIKPENIMVRSDGSAVVMDIGVAELTDNNEHTLHTSVRDFVGSVRFASPQFILGEGAFTAADDVYSIGATLFLLFTGKIIYEEVERKPVLPIVVVNEPPKVDSLQENIPASMKVLLQGCLHRNRKRRPSLEELAECIENPSSASYITRELELQAAENRNYTVLEVMDDGASFFADLAGDNLVTEETHRVVRLGKRLMVPSYNREITAEMFVAEAVLKHIHANVGHFAVLGKRWQEGRSPSNSSLASVFGMAGHWVDHEKATLIVRKGDMVLKRTSGS